MKAVRLVIASYRVNNVQTTSAGSHSATGRKIEWKIMERNEWKKEKSPSHDAKLPVAGLNLNSTKVLSSLVITLTTPTTKSLSQCPYTDWTLGSRHPLNFCFTRSFYSCWTWQMCFNGGCSLLNYFYSTMFMLIVCWSLNGIVDENLTFKITIW